MATRTVAKYRNTKNVKTTRKAAKAAPAANPNTTPAAETIEAPKASTAVQTQDAPAGAPTTAVAPETATPPATAPAQAPAAATEVPPEEAIKVPLNVLTAALAIAAKTDTRDYLKGIYLHAVNAEEMHVVATDGHRLFAAVVKPDSMPSWGERGIILSREWLADALGFIRKLSDSTVLSYAPGQRRATIADSAGTAQFRVAVIDGVFPDYLRIMQNNTRALEGNPVALESATLDAKYLKSAGQVAAILGAQRITPFIGEPDDPAMFAFDCDVPAWLYIMPMRGETTIQGRALAMLGPGLKGTLAALKAHRTRLLAAQKEAKDEAAKKSIAEKIARIDTRIGDIMNLADKPAALHQAA